MIGQGLHIAASSSLKGSSESGGQLKDRISKKKIGGRGERGFKACASASVRLTLRQRISSSYRSAQLDLFHHA